MRPPFSHADATGVTESFPSESIIEVAPVPVLPGSDAHTPQSAARVRLPHEDTTREQVLLELERSVSEAEIREPAPRAPVVPVAPRIAARKAVDPRARRRVVSVNVAFALGAVVLAQSGVIAWLATRPAPPPGATPLLIESPQNGATVRVNGEVVGATPLQVTVGPETRSIQLDSVAPSAAALQAAGPAREAIPAVVPPRPSMPEPTPTRQGGLKLVSPIELTVVQGDRVLGSSAETIFLSAGTHQVQLLNAALGLRLSQSLTVRAGQIGTQRIDVPNGRLSANAQPWGQVWVDGTLLGETPLANKDLVIGEHEVVFRHPTLGERRERVTIRPDAVTRISVNFNR